MEAKIGFKDLVNRDLTIGQIIEVENQLKEEVVLKWNGWDLFQVNGLNILISFSQDIWGDIGKLWLVRKNL